MHVIVESSIKAPPFTKATATAKIEGGNFHNQKVALPIDIPQRVATRISVPIVPTFKPNWVGLGISPGAAVIAAMVVVV